MDSTLVLHLLLAYSAVLTVALAVAFGTTLVYTYLKLRRLP